MKALLGNKLNDFCLDTICFLSNVGDVLWDSFFGITASANWGRVFDLEIETLLLLYTKLS